MAKQATNHTSTPAFKKASEAYDRAKRDEDEIDKKATDKTRALLRRLRLDKKQAAAESRRLRAGRELINRINVQGVTAANLKAAKKLLGM